MVSRLVSRKGAKAQRNRKEDNRREFGTLEPVSKPPHDDHEASKLYEPVKQIGMIFIACDEPAEVLKPADRAFDLPASAIAPELATVLCGRPLGFLAVRTDVVAGATVEWLLRQA